MAQYTPNAEPNIYHIYKFKVTDFLTEEETRIKQAADEKQNDFLRILKSQKWQRKLLTAQEKEIEKSAKKIRKSLVEAIISNKDQRILPEGKLKNKYCVIGVAPSTLTRALKWQDKYTGPTDRMDDIIVVSAIVGKKYKSHALKLLKDLVFEGFNLKGEEYVFLTASAGQIRNREAMFIRKSEYDKVYNTLSCGLTWDKINSTADEKGNTGIIANKYMAYMALSASTSKEFRQFPIDKCIVVNDFESPVTGIVDYVAFDKDKYSITRKEMDVPIPHTDGCGMILYNSEKAKNKTKEAFTIRGPWIKGLLVPFDFVNFIKEADAKEPNINHRVIKDIYDDPHDVIAEKIEVIFTKSQFKMWRYYSSWEEYKANFKKYNCEFAKCKKQGETVKCCKTSYQFLQTLTDIKDEELKKIVSDTNKKLKQKCTDPIYIFNSHTDKRNKKKKGGEHRPLWDAVELYPVLLTDSHTRDELRKEAESFRNKALGGKLVVDGKNTFLAPDLYAFCEYLFLGKTNPKGLVDNGKVSCSLYKDGEKLDCLRSPQWSREHAIRVNCLDSECKKWFCDEVCFFSCHDLITKILQADFDGDTGLVCNDKTLVEVAERNMEGVVPLYYKMEKGKPKELTQQTLYDGMEAAYRYSIGTLANPITKLWNQCPDDKSMEYIKVLTAASNFYVDYAKTLYSPILPPDVQQKEEKLRSDPFPWFWQHTKNFKKAKTKAERYKSKNSNENDTIPDDEINEEIYTDIVKCGIAKKPSDYSTVDRICKYLEPKPYINLNAYRKKVGKVDCKLLTNNPKKYSKIVINPEIIELYKKSSREDALIPEGIYLSDEEKRAFFIYACSTLKSKLRKIDPDEVKITDMLVKYLFDLNADKQLRKAMFWQCFGEQVVKNLEYNLYGTKVCPKCLERFTQQKQNQRLCPNCQIKYQSKSRSLVFPH